VPCCYLKTDTKERVLLSFRSFKIRDNTEITGQCTRKMGGGSYLPVGRITNWVNKL
jgi:hypothetical protein